MYKQKTVEFKSTNTTDTIKGIVYIPKSGEIKGIVQICHGMCEHIGRYHNFAEFLCDNGYIVCGHDHVGHGETAPSEYMLGYFAHEKGWQVLIDDTYKFTRAIKDMYPDYPLFLLGHSMGPFVARLYASYYIYSIDGLILSGTGSKNPGAKAGIALCNAMIASKGEMYRSPKIQKLSFGKYNSKYSKVRTPSDWLTRDEAIVDEHLSDEKCRFIFTTSGFRDLFTLNEKSNEYTTFKNTFDELPIYIFSGDKDPVGDYGRGVKKVYENYIDSGKTDVTLRIYEDGRHEMLNEINRQEVYKDVLTWLDIKAVIKI